MCDDPHAQAEEQRDRGVELGIGVEQALDGRPLLLRLGDQAPDLAEGRLLADLGGSDLERTGLVQSRGEHFVAPALSTGRLSPVMAA